MAEVSHSSLADLWNGLGLPQPSTSIFRLEILRTQETLKCLLGGNCRDLQGAHPVARVKTMAQKGQVGIELSWRSVCVAGVKLCGFHPF